MEAYTEPKLNCMGKSTPQWVRLKSSREYEVRGPALWEREEVVGGHADISDSDEEGTAAAAEVDDNGNAAAADGL